jgi:hypothetical protein
VVDDIEGATGAGIRSLLICREGIHADCPVGSLRTLDGLRATLTNR